MCIGDSIIKLCGYKRKWEWGLGERSLLCSEILDRESLCAMQGHRRKQGCSYEADEKAGVRGCLCHSLCGGFHERGRVKQGK
jgi:hypothetical protein